MILIDIPMPETCKDCPCSYWIQSGENKDMMMCNAMEFAGDPENLIDENAVERPEGCPIITRK